MATEEEDDQEKRSGKGNVDRRIQVEGWRKMEAAAQNRAEGGERWSVTAYVSTHNVRVELSTNTQTTQN